MGVERREKRYQKLLDCTAKSTAHIWPSPSFQGFFFSSLSLGASSRWHTATMKPLPLLIMLSCLLGPLPTQALHRRYVAGERVAMHRGTLTLITTSCTRLSSLLKHCTPLHRLMSQDPGHPTTAKVCGRASDKGHC